MNMKKNKEKYAEWIFLISIFTLYIVWAVIVPFGQGPDEKMRYTIPQFIYKHGKLPIGSDPEIRDPMWGISYAYYPMLSYAISGMFMKIMSIFNSSANALLFASRLVSVLLSTGTGFFCLKIGKKLFKGVYVWVFAILVTLLPEFVFISSYTSCEALSVFSVAWITYALINGKDKKWDIKSTIFLGLGLSVCILSYYNAYGMLLAAILYAVLSVVLDKEYDAKTKNKLIWSRIGIVLLVVLICTGWWFVRNYIIYDGDILGMMTSSKNAEEFAVEALKPSNRSTPNKAGYSLSYMLFDMKWLSKSIQSFIAVFGAYSVWATDEIYSIFYTIGIIGFICAIIIPRKKNGKVKLGKDGLFGVTMLYMCILTVGISLYYSYFNDYQPQGRYFIAAVVALAYFVTLGLQKLALRLPDIAGRILGSAVCMTVVYINIYIVVNIVIPYWY